MCFLVWQVIEPSIFCTYGWWWTTVPWGESLITLDWTGQNGNTYILIFFPPNLASKCLERLHSEQLPKFGWSTSSGSVGHLLLWFLAAIVPKSHTCFQTPQMARKPQTAQMAWKPHVFNIWSNASLNYRNISLPPPPPSTLLPPPPMASFFHSYSFPVSCL